MVKATKQFDEMFLMDDDVQRFLSDIKSLKRYKSHPEQCNQDEAHDAFFRSVWSTFIGTHEILTLASADDVISYDHYEALMSTLDSKILSTLAVMGPKYGDIEGEAFHLEKTVSEFIGDNCEELAKLYAGTYVKHEATRQRTIARSAHTSREADRLEAGDTYDHETAPNKYANVREKAVQRVGEALKYPSVPHQSQYGFKSLGVIRFVRELLYPVAEMDAFEQVIYDHMLHYTDEYGYVSIGYNQITQERNIAKSTAIRAKKKLISKGLISEVFTGNGLSGKTSRYRLTLSCSAGMESEEFLAKRWYVLTGKTDMNKRWDKLVEIQNAK